MRPHGVRPDLGLLDSDFGGHKVFKLTFNPLRKTRQGNSVKLNYCDENTVSFCYRSVSPRENARGDGSRHFKIRTVAPGLMVGIATFKAGSFERS